MTSAGTGIGSTLGPPRITGYLDDELRGAPLNPHLSPFVPAVPRSIKLTAVNAHAEVFGYVNASNLASASVGYQTWNFNDLSTVALFGLHILTDGSFSYDRGWQEWNSSDLTALMNRAHPLGVKVVPSIIFHDFSSTNGGATMTPMCQALMPSATSHTVADVTSEVKAKGADGFNMDYEGNNQTCPGGQTQAQLLVSLMQQLRSSLAGYYISIATYNASYYTGYYFDIPGLNPYVDSFFLMDYDSDQSNYQDEPLKCAVYCFSPTAPLGRYTYNDSNSVAGYLGIVPASKIILGVPYYGYTACIDRAYIGTSRPGPNAVPYTSSTLAHWSVPRYLDSSTTNGQAGVSSFATTYDIYTNADSYSTWYDSDYSCWRESYWSDTYSLGKKYDLVNSNKLRGVGIFTLDYGGGASELWQLLQTKFLGCTSASVSSSPSSPQVAGSSVKFTATAGGCITPEYEYWLKGPSGTSTLQRSFSTDPTWTWNTSGSSGTYTVTVWANQAGNQTSNPEALSAMTYSLASPVNTSVPDGTLVHAIGTPDTQIYRIVGGAPLLLTSCGYLTNCASPTQVADLTHFAPRPAERTLIRGVASNPQVDNYYRVVGGSPLWLGGYSNCQYLTNCDRAVEVNQGTIDSLDHLNAVPSESVFVWIPDTAPARYYRIVGGAPLLLTSCNYLTSCPPASAVQVRLWTILNDRTHLNAYPSDGRFLMGVAGNPEVITYYRTAGEAALKIDSPCSAKLQSCLGAVQVNTATATGTDHLLAKPLGGTVLYDVDTGTYWTVVTTGGIDSLQSAVAPQPTAIAVNHSSILRFPY